jgi:polyisoprenoid-binding protein YceI
MKKLIPTIAVSLLALSLGGCVIANDNSKTEIVSPAAVSVKTLLSSSAETLKAQPSGNYSSEPTHTSLTWRIGHMGLSQYTARFEKVSADLVFDSQDPTKSRVSANIDPLSVSTGLPGFNKEIGEQFLKSMPMTFKSTSLVKTGAVTGKMTGDLTFLGVTKPVTLDVTFNGGRDHPFAKVPAIGFSAHGFVKRSEFGLDKYIPMLTDDVEVFIETEFLKK